MCPLDKTGVRMRVIVVQEAVAGRAVPANIERSAARLMPRRFRVVGVPRAPAREEAERPGQFRAFGSEHVRSSRRTIRIRPSHHQSIPLQPLKPLGQDIGRNARDLIEQLIEPARAAQQRFDDE